MHVLKGHSCAFCSKNVSKMCMRFHIISAVHPPATQPNVLLCAVYNDIACLCYFTTCIHCCRTCHFPFSYNLGFFLSRLRWWMVLMRVERCSPVQESCLTISPNHTPIQRQHVWPITELCPLISATLSMPGTKLSYLSRCVTPNFFFQQMDSYSESKAKCQPFFFHLIMLKFCPLFDYISTG